MNEFQGFPARMEFTSVPNIVFSALLPQIADMAELKVTLHVIAALYRKKGAPRYVTAAELLADAAVTASLRDLGDSIEETLHEALKQATARGTFISLERADGDDVYLLNDEAGRRAVARAAAGELELGGGRARRATPPPEPLPDIFTAYEKNIGMLTPMISEQLKDAEQQYSADWIRDAIKEAVFHNKRHIAYILKILETWSTEGRTDGTYQRHPEKADPDRYVKGKYGHIVQR